MRDLKDNKKQFVQFCACFNIFMTPVQCSLANNCTFHHCLFPHASIHPNKRLHTSYPQIGKTEWREVMEELSQDQFKSLRNY